MNEEENWLHGKQIECPNCHQWLYRVDHSPFYDEFFGTAIAVPSMLRSVTTTQ